MIINLANAKKILNAMFFEYNFDFEIIILEKDEFFFIIKNPKSMNLINNNQLLLRLRNEKNKIKIYCEIWCENWELDWKLIGYYLDDSNKFFAKKDFWQVMFSEHLK